MSAPRSTGLKKERTSRPTRAALGACAALAVLVLAVYAQTSGFDFVILDDNDYVTENPQVRAGLTPGGLIWAFTATHSANWHPVTWLSHMLDCQLYGLHAGGHHATSVLLHAACAIVLFLVLVRMTRLLWRSAFVAALFAVHPLHVESVAWVAERKDVLSTLFGLVALWAWVRYVERPGWVRYLAAAVAYVLSLLSKPMWVTFPFLLLLLDYWPLGRLQLGSGTAARNWALVREKLPLVALAAASSVVTFAAQRGGGAVRSIDVLPLGLRIENAVVSYAAYLGKTLWPSGLSAFYSYTGLAAWQVAASALLLGAVTWLAVRARQRAPYLAVGWFWYVGTLVPVIGLVQVGSQAMADRYTYLPLVGVFIMLAWGVPDLLLRRRESARKPTKTLELGASRALPVAAGLVIAILASSAWLQARHWRDTVTLFERVLSIDSEILSAHNSLGVALAMRGRTDEAIHHYREALRIKPDYVGAHYNLAQALEAKGEAAEAVRHYSEALRGLYANGDIHYRLGSLLAGAGDATKAVHHFSEAIRFKPGFPDAQYAWGNALVSLGKPREAIPHYREAARLKPDHASAHANLAAALYLEGDLRGAWEEVRLCREAGGTPPPSLVKALAEKMAGAK